MNRSGAGKAPLTDNRTMRRLVHEALARLGHDPQAVMLGALPGGDPALCDPHDEAPLFWAGVATVTGDPYIGLRMAEAVPARLIDEVLMAMYSAENFRQALDDFLRYQHLLSGAFQARLDRPASDPDQARLVFNLDYPGFPPLRQQAECMALLLLKLFRLLTDGVFQLSAVEFRHRAPANLDLYPSRLGCLPLFDQPDDELVFSADILDRPALTANPTLRALLRERLERQRRDFQFSQFLMRLRLWLDQQPGEPPGPSECARALGVRPIDLRRRLGDYDLDYKELVEESRQRRGAFGPGGSERQE